MNSLNHDDVQPSPFRVRSVLTLLVVMALVSAVLAFFLAPYL